MTKSTKQPQVEKPKKDRNIKAKATGFYSLMIALAELATVYIFTTQDNKILLPIAVVLGIDAAQRFTRAFTK